MTGAEILAAIGMAFSKVLDFGNGIIDYLSKGKPDATELARMQHDYDTALADLDFKIKQAGIWVQQQLIDMEKVTGARWRAPLILASGFGLILVSLNNILAACYLSWAHPVDMLSPPMGVLAGMFLLLVTGSADLLVSVFRPKQKEGKSK